MTSGQIVKMTSAKSVIMTSARLGRWLLLLTSYENALDLTTGLFFRAIPSVVLFLIDNRARRLFDKLDERVLVKKIIHLRRQF